MKAVLLKIPLITFLTLLAWSMVAGSEEIHDAVRAGKIEKVKALIAANPDLVDARDREGKTPLHWAWKEDIATLLLEHGADVNAKNAQGNTPLWTPVMYGRKNIAIILLTNGADVNARDNSGETPLHKVSIHSLPNSRDIAALLLKHGADVNAKSNNGWTPLHSANTKDVAEILLSHGADVHARDNRGRTPLHWAYKEVAELLLANGAEVDSRDNSGRTPLHTSFDGHCTDYSTKWKDFAELLITNGANVDARDNRGRTPLHVIARYLPRSDGGKGVAEFLLANKADINAKNNYGETPLYKASTSGNNVVVRILLDNKADVNIMSNGGKIPSIMAAENGHEDIVKLFLSIEPDINVQKQLKKLLSRGICKANLQKIWTAVTLYSRDYNNALPDDIRSLYPQHIEGGHLLKCPGDKTIPAMEKVDSSTPVSYTWVKGLKMGKNQGEIIIAYDASPENHEGEGRCVLFLDGSAKWLPENEFQELLMKQTQEKKT